MEIEKILFRCSCLGQIMTEARSKSEPLSETAKSYCKVLIRELKYNRYKEVVNKYLEKGTMVEGESIEMYAKYIGIDISKNESYFKNDFIKGTPDILINGEVTEDGELPINEIYDIKSSWDLFTLPFASDKIDKDYYWQLMGYMALTGAKKAKVIYCLVNTPGVLITKEKNWLLQKIQGREDVELVFPKLSAELERNMIFDDIPVSERIIEFEVLRDDLLIESIYKRVAECRNYLKSIS